MVEADNFYNKYWSMSFTCMYTLNTLLVHFNLCINLQYINIWTIYNYKQINKTSCKFVYSIYIENYNVNLMTINVVYIIWIYTLNICAWIYYNIYVCVCVCIHNLIEALHKFSWHSWASDLMGSHICLWR